MPFNCVTKKIDLYNDDVSHFDANVGDSSQVTSATTSSKKKQKNKDYLSRAIYFDPFLDTNCSYLKAMTLMIPI